jgi:apolipoprotein N-acyltransferase
MTRIRAVEEGLPVLRSANNGITAVIDAFGGLDEPTGANAGRLRTLSLNARGTIDASLPATVGRPPYARFGDAMFWGLVAMGIILVVIGRFLERNGSQPVSR